MLHIVGEYVILTATWDDKTIISGGCNLVHDYTRHAGKKDLVLGYTRHPGKNDLGFGLVAVESRW